MVPRLSFSPDVAAEFLTVAVHVLCLAGEPLHWVFRFFSTDLIRSLVLNEHLT